MINKKFKTIASGYVAFYPRQWGKCWDVNTNSVTCLCYSRAFNCKSWFKLNSNVMRNVLCAQIWILICSLYIRYSARRKLENNHAIFKVFISPTFWSIKKSKFKVRLTTPTFYWPKWVEQYNNVEYGKVLLV